MQNNQFSVTLKTLSLRNSVCTVNIEISAVAASLHKIYPKILLLLQWSALAKHTQSRKYCSARAFCRVFNCKCAHLSIEATYNSARLKPKILF